MNSWFSLLQDFVEAFKKIAYDGNKVSYVSPAPLPNTQETLTSTIVAKSFEPTALKGKKKALVRGVFEKFLGGSLAHSPEGFRRRDLDGLLQQVGINYEDQAVGLVLCELRKQGVLTKSSSTKQARYIMTRINNEQNNFSAVTESSEASGENDSVPKASV